MLVCVTDVTSRPPVHLYADFLPYVAVYVLCMLVCVTDVTSRPPVHLYADLLS